MGQLNRDHGEGGCLESGRGNGSWRGHDPGRGQLNRSL